jgi:hypothetical protein
MTVNLPIAIESNHSAKQRNQAASNRPPRVPVESGVLRAALLIALVACADFRPGLMINVTHPSAARRDPDPTRPPDPVGEASMPADVQRPSRALGLTIAPAVEDLVITTFGYVACALSARSSPAPTPRCLVGVTGTGR